MTNSTQLTTSVSARLAVSTPPQASYFVATNGDDGANGSQAEPFATLQRAQRAMQDSTIKVTQIEGGTYYLSSALMLTDADQGETWKAASESTVILSGGKVIAGWVSEGNGVYSAQSAKLVGLNLTIGGVHQVPTDRGYDPDQPYTSGWKLIASTPGQGYSFTWLLNQ